MSSKIVRGGDERRRKARVSSAPDVPGVQVVSRDTMGVEKEAYEQGYKEGERIGKEMGERMVTAAVQRYDRAVQEISSLHQVLHDEMERGAVQLALAVARRIVQREVSMEPDLVAALVSVALKRLHGQTGITARVSSQDFARVEPTLRAANSNLVIQEDGSLERGDFMLDSTQTHIDGRVESQIDAIGRALLDG
jgi:flagellar assembly protein FliH